MGKERKMLKEQIKYTVLNSKKPMDVYNIAKTLDCTSYIVARMLLEMILENIEEIEPEILERLDIRPLKTTKSLILIPQK